MKVGAAGAAAGALAAGAVEAVTPGTVNLTASSADAATNNPKPSRPAVTLDVNFMEWR